MAGGQEAAAIYAIIKGFNLSEWKEFARTQLILSPNDMEEIDFAYPKDLKEQKYQMVLAWQRRNGRRANSQSLQQLVEHYLNPRFPQQQHFVATPTTDIQDPFELPSGTAQSSVSGLAPVHSAMPLGSAPDDQHDPTPRGKKFPEAAEHHSKPRAFLDDKASCKKKEEVNGQQDPRSGEPASADLTEENLHGGTADDGKAGVIKKMLSSLKKKKGPPEQSLCDKVEKVKVLLTSAEQYKKHLKLVSEIYQVKKPDKGCVLIMNNTFKEGRILPKRFGSHLDVKHMEKLWTGLGCKLHNDTAQCEKTAGEMKTLIGEVAQLEDKYDFVVLIIMSHGGLNCNGEEVFYGDDGGEVKIKEALQLFHNTEAKSLHHMPKFFIFQCCRGGKIDRGVTTDSSSSSSAEDFDQSLESMLKYLIENNTTGNVVTDGSADVIPSISDILVAYATHDEHTAIRNGTHGSWFINAITNVFMKHAKDEHVADMLTRVHSAMKAKTGEGKDNFGNDVRMKAMSNHHTSFSKKLYLFPGYP